MITVDENIFPGANVSRTDGDAWLVMKFGGTSVSSAELWQTIVQLVTERLAAGFRPVIVHSAVADVSNQLEEAIAAAISGEHEPFLEKIIQRHLELATDLGVDGVALLADNVATLEQLLAGIRLVREVSPRVQVNILSQGELMATRLSAAYLCSQGLDVHWLDAREELLSEDRLNDSEQIRYLSASCNFEPDAEMQARFANFPGVILTQGFVARNPHHEGVLLGRGGSDTSAAYFAAKLQARGLEIWTDVPGMFSADPHQVSGARLLKALSYQEAQEIASTGASVLHPRCLRPVRTYGIPLRVRCTLRPELAGTLISTDSGSDAPRVKAISSRSGITVISMETLGMWHEAGFLADAFRCFSDLGVSVDLVSTGESNVTVTLNLTAEPIATRRFERLLERLEKICRVTVIENTDVVSLVGNKIRAMLHIIGPALEVFQEHRIHLVSQAANDLNFSFVIEEGQAHRLIQRLHAGLVKPASNDPIFGSTWEELQEDAVRAEEVRPAWWLNKREQLLEIAEREESAYVYDLDTISGACSRLTGLENIDQVFFAIKSNSHPGVLSRIYESGVNLECVSPGEIGRVLDLFPGIDRRRILFTPNFAARAEYAMALNEGIWVTLDNLHPLRHWGNTFQGSELFLRIDTGQGRGHHEHVRTAGVHSKFGIPLFELEEAAELLRAAGAKVVGLHAHTGSGILRADNWQDVAESLLDVRQLFPDLQILDLGGGLGIPEKPGELPLDISAVDASLARARELFPQYELWLEPGRYIVAEAGVLLATVTQVKGKGDVQYVGISTGMNSLVRPAMYGAYHEIVNLTRLHDAPEYLVNVVGNICESGDSLGNDRRLPVCQEGDVMLIANTGAYGFVMSSHYNLRNPAVEVVL
jgi:diaminopimelate decarboxylase/aspartate kinase